MPFTREKTIADHILTSKNCVRHVHMPEIVDDRFAEGVKWGAHANTCDAPQDTDHIPYCGDFAVIPISGIFDSVASKGPMSLIGYDFIYLWPLRVRRCREHSKFRGVPDSEYFSIQARRKQTTASEQGARLEKDMQSGKGEFRGEWDCNIWAWQPAQHERHTDLSSRRSA